MQLENDSDRFKNHFSLFNKTNEMSDYTREQAIEEGHFTACSFAKCQSAEVCPTAVRYA